MVRLHIQPQIKDAIEKDMSGLEMHKRLADWRCEGLAKTIRISLALIKAGLPVEIHDVEELRTRLLGMD